MKYAIEQTKTFYEDAVKLYKSEPKAFEKLSHLLLELEEHPRTGTGHPEQLKHYDIETWSRKISKKHRLVYEIHDDTVLVMMLSAYGHYEDK